MKTIGMVGVGLMGHGIATNLAKHGFNLVLFEHNGNQPLESLKAAGATVVKSLAELAASSDAVILVLTGSAQVEAVLAGEGGIFNGLRGGTVVIDCSTAMPSSTKRMAQAAAERGGLFIDAPMTRTPKEAAEGRLNLLVGGDPGVVSLCEPVLRSFAENITHVGPVGAGHSMKLLHNFVSLGMVTLLSEAAVCARLSDVSPQSFVEVLANGGGGGVALERMRPYLLDADPSGLRFSIANAAKDLRYYGEMAESAHAPRDVAESVLRVLDRATSTLGGDAFMPQLSTL
jgi:3-hydroxyisobutyrate dehydrogenase-like beta-hydroxyacid dehydrogenase